jgi:hypothetical protein
VHQALDWALAIGSALLFLGMVQRARQAHGGRPAASRKGSSSRKGGWLAHRRELRRLREKHKLDTARENTRHEQQMEREKARTERDRENRWRREGGGEGGGPRERVRRTLRLRPDGTAAPDAPGSGASDLANDPDAPDDRGGGEPPPASGPKPPPSPARPPAPVPARANARPPREEAPVTSPSIATVAIEDVLLGIDRSASAGKAGNVHAKRRTLAELSAVAGRLDDAIQSLARSMAEEGLYGPEITDPMSGPASNAAAAARGLAEVDSVIASLLAIPAGELAGSGYGVPHHSELAENAAR